MKSWIKDKIIWVTGASSGIGRSLAVKLAEMENTVYASSRNSEPLEELAKQTPGIIALPVDISDRESVLKAVGEIKEKHGSLDIAVLNAGICEYVDTDNFDSKLVERVMQVNFNGAVYCLEAVLPLFRKSEKPYLVGVSSTVAYVELPRAEAYGASKAALKYFLDSLRIDLRKEKIDVSVVCPGFVKTPLTDKNDFPMPMRITVEQSTDYIISGMNRRKQEIHYPKLFSYSLKILGILPKWIRNYITAKMVN